MFEQIIVGLIVVFAALYVLRRLRRAAAHPTGCDPEACAQCAFRGGCKHPAAETPPHKTAGTTPVPPPSAGD